MAKDLLAEIVDERTRRNPALPRLVAEATARRELATRREKKARSETLIGAPEIAPREAALAAAEAYFEKYHVPPLDDEAARPIEAEWRGKGTPTKTRRRRV